MPTESNFLEFVPEGSNVLQVVSITSKMGATYLQIIWIHIQCAYIVNEWRIYKWMSLQMKKWLRKSWPLNKCSSYRYWHRMNMRCLAVCGMFPPRAISTITSQIRFQIRSYSAPLSFSRPLPMVTLFMATRSCNSPIAFVVSFSLRQTCSCFFSDLVSLCAEQHTIAIVSEGHKTFFNLSRM